MAMTKEEAIIANRVKQQKYASTHDRINARLEAGVIDRIKALGYKSANSFLVDAVMEKLKREEKKVRTNEVK